jgi:hypothetical protein
MPCSVVAEQQHFEGPCYLHQHPEHGSNYRNPTRRHNPEVDDLNPQHREDVSSRTLHLFASDCFALFSKIRGLQE